MQKKSELITTIMTQINHSKRRKKTHRLEQLQGKLRFERCRQDSFQYIETSPHRN